eukprot:scaffold7079_cov128-Isochrysis_galbana.AAC.10
MGDPSRYPEIRLARHMYALQWLQAKDRASRRMSESRGSVIDSYLDVGIPSGDVFRRELDSDEFARDMMDYLLVNLQSDDRERASQIPLLASRFVMKDGLLYYLSKAESTDSADLRLYIPESLRHSYMVAFHDSAGHLGPSIRHIPPL